MGKKRINNSIIQNLNIMKAAIKYLIIWLLINIVASVVVYALGYIVSGLIGHPFAGVEDMISHPWITSIALLATDLLVIFVFWKMKYARLGFNYGYTFGENFSNQKLYLWAFVAGLGLLIFDLMAGFYLPIPEDNEIIETLKDMMTNPIGLLSVCLIGPLSEEIICRGAIERRLLEKNWNPWYAIVISALLFAVAHLNFAQGFSATVIGIFMGWVYYRTRSIWPTVFIHVVNNTVACLIALAAPDAMYDENFTLPLTIGIPLTVVSIILIALAAKKIGWLTKDRTPIPAPVTEVLPPPLPVEAMENVQPVPDISNDTPAEE